MTRGFVCFLFFLLVVAVDSVAANMPVNLTHFVAFLFVFLFASQLFSSTFRFAVFINHSSTIKSLIQGARAHRERWQGREQFEIKIFDWAIQCQ